MFVAIVFTPQKTLLLVRGHDCEIIYMGRGRDRALSGGRCLLRKLRVKKPPTQKDILVMPSVKKYFLIFMRDLSYEKL